jgi:redox-sensitive bicupin YhaK (pirin superfamily)
LEIPSSDERPHVWLQVISGEVKIAGETLGTADGVAIQNDSASIPVEATAKTKFLLFRLS